MKRRLNVKFLACLLGIGAALGTGAHFLRGYQVRRNAGAIRQRADQAVASGQLDEAIREYRRYLSLVPDDGNAWGDYGLVLDRTAKSPREREAVVTVLD